MVDSVFNFTNSLNAANDTLAKMKADFQTKYQYTVMGQTDVLFGEVGGAAMGGSDDFNAIKGYRTSELINLSNINRSTDSADAKAKQTGVVQLNFVNNSLTNISNVVTAGKSGSSEEIASALAALTDHLQDAVDGYAAAVANGTVDAAKDAGFATAAKTARFTIVSQSIKVRALLASDNVIFNADMYNLNNQLNEILSKINAITGGGAQAQAAAPAGALDVTV